MSHGSISTAPACGNARPPVSIESSPCHRRMPHTRHAVLTNAVETQGGARTPRGSGACDGERRRARRPAAGGRHPQPAAYGIQRDRCHHHSGRKCVTQARGPEERRQAGHVTGALPRASSAGAGGACAREMGRTDRAPADMQWEAQFPSSQTSTAELCYLDGVLVRLRETPTHHLQEVPCRLRIHPPHAPSLPQRACPRLTGTSRRLIAQRWACATRVARGWCSSAAQRGRLRCI